MTLLDDKRDEADADADAIYRLARIADPMMPEAYPVEGVNREAPLWKALEAAVQHGRATSVPSAIAATVTPKHPELMQQRTIDTVARDAARYRFRHSNYVDKDGYEYGYCKVRWKGGRVDSMLWADDDEIDAAMAADALRPEVEEVKCPVTGHGCVEACDGKPPYCAKGGA